MKTITALILVLLFLHTACHAGDESADRERNEAQIAKERALAITLQNLVNCKMTAGMLFCHLSFRGLQLEFAGPNNKNSSTIYIHALGKNQRLSTRGSKCVSIAFNDEDLRGRYIEAEILFRDDAVITHNYINKKAWAECS